MLALAVTTQSLSLACVTFVFIGIRGDWGRTQSAMTRALVNKNARPNHPVLEVGVRNTSKGR